MACMAYHKRLPRKKYSLKLIFYILLSYTNVDLDLEYENTTKLSE